MTQMTDAEVIKALECCSKKDCKQCPCFDVFIECGENLIKTSLDLINRLRNDAKKDNRIIELQDKKIAELEAQNNDLFYKLNGVMLFVDKWLEGKELKQDEVNRAITMREKTLQIVEKLEAEVERLQKVNAEFGEAGGKLVVAFKKAKSEAYREFAEILKKEVAYIPAWGAVAEKKINNTLKELTEKNDFKVGDEK